MAKKSVDLPVSNVDRKAVRNLDTLDYERRERLALLRLTPQEKRLCEVFVTTMDWRSAMVEAGYYVANTGNEMLDIQANTKRFDEILAAPQVAEYIMLLKESVLSRLGFGLDDIIEELRRIAFSKLSDFYSWDEKGIKHLKADGELTEAEKSAVMEVSYIPGKYGDRVTVKMFPKQAALDRLLEILQKLEEITKARQSEQRPVVINKNTVKVFLQDPVKRRAIEHIAQGLFSRRFCLVSNDQQQQDFDKVIETGTTRYLRQADEQRKGIKGGGIAGALPYEPDGGSEGEDGDY